MRDRAFALVSLLVSALAACGAPPRGDPENRTPAIAFKGVRVFDGEKVIPRADVVIRGEKIVSVGEDIALPADAEVIDGAGLTLLPGLIDAHTHTWGEDHLEQALTFGVTTELDMMNSPVTAAELRRKSSARGSGLADLFSAGNAVTCPKGHGTEYGFPVPTIDKAEEALTFIDRRVAEGSDYIKIVYDTAVKAWMPTIGKDVLVASVAAAHRRQRLAVVHIGIQTDARDAIEAGADGLAHLFLGSAPEKDFGACAADHKAFVVPTLSVLLGCCGTAAGTSLVKDPEIAPYLSGSMIGSLKQTFPRAFGSAREYEWVEQTVRLLQAARVPVLAGTDCPNPGTAHGASLHGELALLVKAGLSPTEALASATTAPARCFKLADRGRIAVGFAADLLLVRGDPTTEIEATRRIVGVWKRGVPFDRKGVLARIEAARKPPPGSESGLISDFEDGKLSARFGRGWTESTDRILGGTSTVRLEIVEGGADGNKYALRVSGEVKKGAPYPWAGATFFPGSRPMEAADLSAWKELSFFARGEGKACTVMLFAESLGPRPAVIEFTPGAEWKRFAFPFRTFDKRLDGHDLTGIAFTSGSKPGAFMFHLDQVELRASESSSEK